MPRGISLTEKVVENIVALYNSGYTYNKIGELTGASQSTVSRVLFPYKMYKRGDREKLLMILKDTNRSTIEKKVCERFLKEIIPEEEEGKPKKEAVSDDAQGYIIRGLDALVQEIQLLRHDLREHTEATERAAQLYASGQTLIKNAIRELSEKW